MTSLVRMDGEEAPMQGRGAPGSKEAPARSLTWAEAETMDILNDKDMMEGIAEGKADVKAGRLVPWEPKDAKNTRSA